MTGLNTVKQQSFRVSKLAAIAGRWLGTAARPRRRAVALAMLLGVGLTGITSPDLRSFGSHEALAAAPALDQVRAGGQIDRFGAANACDRDQYFQEAFSWDELISYVTGTRASFKSVSRVGFCVEKPRTTRPGVAGGNRWDYWDDYWARERHKNDPTWWGW